MLHCSGKVDDVILEIGGRGGTSSENMFSRNTGFSFRGTASNLTSFSEKISSILTIRLPEYV